MEQIGSRHGISLVDLVHVRLSVEIRRLADLVVSMPVSVKTAERG